MIQSLPLMLKRFTNILVLAVTRAQFPREQKLLSASKLLKLISFLHPAEKKKNRPFCVQIFQETLW